LRIYSLSTYFGYSSFRFPQNTPGSVNATADSRRTIGLLGSAGWQRFRGRTNFSIRYTGSYGRDINQSSLDRLNHSVFINLTRPLGRKWRVDFSADGQDSTYEQFVFDNSTLATIVQTPASVDDLAASMSVGQFTSTQGAVLLGGTNTAASPTRALLLGSSILTYGARAGLSYAPTSRLNIRFGSFALGGEHRSNASTGLQPNYIIPRTFGGDASVSISYLFSSRTSLELDAGQNYISTRQLTSSGTSATIGLGRKMGRHWFLRGYMGGYFIAHQSGGSPVPPQTIGGASLGFTTYGNTLLASYSRSGYDLTAGGVGGNSLFSGAWAWRRPRNNWGLNASYSYTKTGTAGLATVSGWHAAVGFNQRLSDNFIMTATCTYLDSRGSYLNISNRIKVEGVRITLGWAPRQRRRDTYSAPDTPENDH